MAFKQREHPVIPLISEGVLLSLPPAAAVEALRRREEAIRLEEEDPFRHGYEPAMWRLVDRQVIERRLETNCEPFVLNVTLLGGIRSGKTDFAAKRIVQHFIYTERAWCWALHETERSSQTIGQGRIYKYLPAEFRTDSGNLKSNRENKLKYKHGFGFTGMAFTLLGRLFDFKVYGADNAALQGAELTCGWSDELVPKVVAETVQERLNTKAALVAGMKGEFREALAYLDAGKPIPGELLARVYTGVHLRSFTPKEGYTPVVADTLDGAVTTIEEPAEILPIYGPRAVDGTQPILGYQNVPRVKRCKRRDHIVCYFHTKDNLYGGNWRGLMVTLETAKDEEKRITAYGDVKKAWAGAFPKFKDTVHVIKRSQVPKKGTWYHVVDPCSGRNFFMGWYLRDAHNRTYVIREWPQAGDYIPGVGDPGDWAVSSTTAKKFDGDMGPAQVSFGFGLNDYKDEIARVEKELGEWWNAKTNADGILEPGPPIVPEERHMDSRFGNAPTPREDASTTLIEEFEEIGIYFEPAPGEHQSEGIQLINTELSFDDSKPVSSLNAPKLYIVDECQAHIFALQNWTGKDGQKGACKDPKDVLSYHLLSAPEDVSGQPQNNRRARAAY